MGSCLGWNSIRVRVKLETLRERKRWDCRRWRQRGKNEEKK
ncbi:uncharacterized protein G2W53_007331 [Senna tora]|uniref:Uncharacterized protein n=1 Tax=Senna tora TaxID=362788 RepID=A0A834X6X7_9FABA|nr:uncharacterized protein G2W53_007331 [Senna tora]